jgi:hypothetical protein
MRSAIRCRNTSRKLRAVPGDARQSAPGGDRAADARRDRARAGRCAAAGNAGEWKRHHTDATTGEDEFAAPRARRLWHGPLPAWRRCDRSRGQVAAEDRDPNDPSTWGKVGRNEACPCGSGKKYKHCHGASRPSASARASPTRPPPGQAPSPAAPVASPRGWPARALPAPSPW